MKLRSIVTYIVLFLLLLVLGFGFYQFRIFITGPKLTVSYPTEIISTVSADIIHIQGSVKNAAYLYINDRQIYTNPEGFFDETLYLLPGYNPITVKLVGKNNQILLEQYQIVRISPLSSGQFNVRSI